MNEKYDEDSLLKEILASSGYPSEDRLNRGPVAVIECVQEIPCNPCESACPHNAIVVGKPITNLPKLIEDKCKGCAECIAICPGQAIFLIDMTYSNEESAISIPYEFFPLPKIGSIVDALDRNGKKVCKGRIIRVANPPKNDKTAVVTIAIPKQYSNYVRSLIVSIGKY